MSRAAMSLDDARSTAAGIISKGRLEALELAGLMVVPAQPSKAPEPRPTEFRARCRSAAAWLDYLVRQDVFVFGRGHTQREAIWRQAAEAIRRMLDLRAQPPIDAPAVETAMVERCTIANPCAEHLAHFEGLVPGKEEPRG